MLKQRWDELRALCETPVKVVWQGGQWTRVSTGPARQIDDIREFLKSEEFGVNIPERASRPEPAEAQSE